jgi:hypothetical protein
LTDNTPEVVRQFDDKRIRYVRQPSFLCAGDNWGACADMAQGDWIVFNQDDDVLSPYFLERCANAIRKVPDIVMYATEFALSPDITCNHGSSHNSFALRHHWDRPQPRLIPGVQIAALCWFMTGFSPPAQGIPTHLLRKHWPRGPEASFLGDHYLTSRVACEGTVAFEGYVGAIIRDHAQRYCHVIREHAARFGNPQARRDYRVYEKCLTALTTHFQEKQLDWQSALREILPEIPLSSRESWLRMHLLNDYMSPDALEILIATIAAEKRVSRAAVIAEAKGDRQQAPRAGRLDRLGLPSSMIRVIRGLLSVVVIR